MKKLIIAIGLVFLLLLTVLYFIRLPYGGRLNSVPSPTGVGIFVINKDCEDLLNSDHPNAFKQKNIKVFYLINDELEEINDPKKGGFTIYKHSGEDRSHMRLTVNNRVGEKSKSKNPITYIQWSENDVDTLQCETIKINGYNRATKPRFNGELITTEHPKKGLYLELIK